MIDLQVIYPANETMSDIESDHFELENHLRCSKISSQMISLFSRKTCLDFPASG